MKKYQNKYRSETTRLKNHDYGADGWYFITICTHHRENYFGDITQNVVGTQNLASLQPTTIGKIAHQYWMEIPTHFPFVVLDEFVIMPDHVHGILYFDKPEHKYQIHRPNKFAPQSKNLASVIRGYKAAVKKYATMNNISFAWQSRYHDHVIRSERELQAVRRYIRNNPQKWIDGRDAKSCVPPPADHSKDAIFCVPTPDPPTKPSNPMPTPLQILQQHFGYSSFRLEQEAIINNVLAKKDTFALMPTGGGKSLCFQVPALIFDGLTIVISPLIALMKDQVDALRLNGVKAAFLNSTQSNSEQEEILNAIKANKLKLLYLAPESTFFKKITSFNVSLIAIDEAHCISHWGHDFRPEYLTLAQLKRTLPHVPVIALTATADRLTRKDILQKLELKDPATFISSFNRANIRYTVEPKRRSFERLIEFLEKRKEESGIIYCLSRASTESLAQDLVNVGYAAKPYHAGLEKEIRARHQEMFLRDEVKIIVATIAFGMGIDKSNVRYVVHTDLPKNIESYYQETGRAGRDGLESEALLFYSYADVNKMKRFVEIDDNPEQTKIYLKKLDQMATYGDLTSCRRKYLLNYFDETAPDYCGNCDVCLTRFELTDATVTAQKALSAVARLQERFGAGYVIDFLRGSSSSKMQEEHKLLKTYSVGADMSKEQWSDVFQQLISQGYLAKSEGNYPVLKLTTKSTAVLKGEEKVMLTVETVETQDIASLPVSPLVSSHTSPHAPLFQHLKDLRKQLAVEENVPAYIVLSDATLMELATYLPHSKEEFSKISGFGQIKLEKYGKQFWNVVTTYCKEHQLKSRIHLKSPKRQRTERPERETDTKQQSFELFKLGHSIEKIAEVRGLSIVTIEGHLAFYVQQGKLTIGQLMDTTKIPVIQEAIEKIGGKVLTPIKEKLGDGYSFGEIKLVIAHLEFLAQHG
jgi:ATP-dependent DNA helicase RecQ